MASEAGTDLARREHGDALSQAERAVYEARFWTHVDQRRPDECWDWTSTRTQGGYGLFRVGARKHPAHRIAYELCVGPIADGLILDHLCRRRSCVNPLHLEPVTHRENTMRGEGVGRRNALAWACVHGHPFTPENTRRWGPKGRRSCLTCQRDAAGRYRRKRAARV